MLLLGSEVCLDRLPVMFKAGSSLPSTRHAVCSSEEVSYCEAKLDAARLAANIRTRDAAAMQMTAFVVMYAAYGRSEQTVPIKV